jgi:hypothetical protein
VRKDLWLEVIAPRWTKGNGLVLAWKTTDPFGPHRGKVAGTMTCIGGIKDYRSYVTMGIEYEGFRSVETFYNDSEHREKWWAHHLVKVWDRFWIEISKDHRTQTFYADENKRQRLGVVVNTPDPGNPRAGKWKLTIKEHSGEYHYDFGSGKDDALQPAWSAECWQAISAALQGLAAAVGFTVFAETGVAIVGVLISMGACAAACQAVAQTCQ